MDSQRHDIFNLKQRSRSVSVVPWATDTWEGKSRGGLNLHGSNLSRTCTGHSDSVLQEAPPQTDEQRLLSTKVGPEKPSLDSTFAQQGRDPALAVDGKTLYEPAVTDQKLAIESSTIHFRQTPPPRGGATSATEMMLSKVPVVTS